PGAVSTETATLLGPLCLLLAATLLASNLAVFFQALGQVPFAAALGVAQAAAYLCLVGGLALAGGLDLEAVVLALVVQQAVALALVAVRASRAGLWHGAFSGEMARGILGAGARQHVATVATFLYMKLNQVLVFRICGAQEAGLFAAALNLSFAFAFIPTTFQNALYPRVIHGTDDFEVTVRALRLGFYGWGAASLVLAALAEPILLVYGGGEFRRAATVFRVLLLSSWLLPLSSFSAPYLIKAGAFNLASASAVVLGAISVALNLLLIPRHAGLGAALATALTCAVGFAMALAMLRHLAGRSPLGFLALRRGA
ncbi:MAG TPA: polysaccharide biosynthesis C-terminal domain-containing protein, partial [Candidatus Methanoperedens sp.]|nr:polysaccharide biosynthesis C-terminal domain-containing protein [Candidatus Methanoperedens sp.]